MLPPPVLWVVCFTLRKYSQIQPFWASYIEPLLQLICVLSVKRPTSRHTTSRCVKSILQEIKESVELPLTHPEYYEEMGIRPPKGVILYGPPGTGKTLLAKAVANQTSATFLRVVGSELVSSPTINITTIGRIYKATNANL